MVRTKAVPKRLRLMEEDVREMIAERILQWEDVAVWRLCIVALNIQARLMKEAEFCAAIEGVRVTKKHTTLAARLMGLL